MTQAANRIAWIAWGLTLPLGFLGPTMRALTSIPGSGPWPIYAAVGVMLAALVYLLILRDRRALFLALAASASAIALGGAGGFVTAALISGKSLGFFLAFKWAIAGAFLTWLFRRQLHEDAEIEATISGLDPEAFDMEAKTRRRLGLSPDDDLEAALVALTPSERDDLMREMTAHLEADVHALRAYAQSSRRRMRTALLSAAVLVLVGVAVYGSSLYLKQKADAARARANR